ncbi:MAG TPA: tetratricopeptide repeat protein [Roseiflexaceae bacterium]|nr:tetratricopeptide repeat protein [Roseiflexaceae bacterium]HMP42492.1 tetratricopeptide repeat protein [Roseiflexaceae bacterium]
MSTEQLREVVRLRGAGEQQAALALLEALHAAHPDDACIAYEYASTFDLVGDEQQAIPWYERALSLGLADPERRGALLGLGSSYRCVGRYNEAITTFEQAATEYADGSEFAAFGALALYNVGRCREAVGILLRLLVETTSDRQVQRYSRALRYYADHPDDRW